MQNFCFSRPVCLLIVFVASCSLVFASENVETAGIYHWYFIFKASVEIVSINR